MAAETPTDELARAREARMAEYQSLSLRLRQLEEERGITMADSFLHVVEGFQPQALGPGVVIALFERELTL
jgi:hypothetical protein